ncbi:gp056 [Rhodococcus phage ReqiPoco6]|uniref:Gp056 n=1 Tax=Rhodococcus phage ReqiPoco6 TaxID=691964 RepID=D4P7S4_9CAUD|nr:gp056 [Rhodococcus phage ReqiPoco6]ADD81054.1 gp056 [Rhodococcus phage ReqiPoco6]
MPEREYWMVPLSEIVPKDTWSRLLVTVSGFFTDLLLVDGSYEKIYVITEEVLPTQDDILTKALVDA